MDGLNVALIAPLCPFLLFDFCCRNPAMLSLLSSNAVFSIVSSPFTPGSNPHVRSCALGLGLKTLTLLVATLSLTGCGSITGLDAGETFSCDVPNGVPCQSLQKAYQQTLIDEHNAQLAKLNSRSTAVMQPLDTDGNPKTPCTTRFSASTRHLRL